MSTEIEKSVDVESHIRGVFGTHDEKTLEQLRDVATRAESVALMADGHVGYVMPIGGIAAYDNKVSVVGVGFDIGCGNAALRTDLKRDAFSREDLEQAANEIQRTISFGVGRENLAGDAPLHHPVLDSPSWHVLETVAGKHEHDSLKAKARDQLGTVGSGNHYVDVFSDEDGFIWVGVHFGSRGLGHTIASGFLALTQGKPWGQHAKEKEVLLDLSSHLGDAYWHLMELAGQYAYAGREWVVHRVAKILGGKEQELVHNHHNFAWKERHEGRELVVVRKGATPAWPGQRGFIGGSMGDDAVIVEGAKDGDAELQRAALYSTVHGAGRVMSRTEARGKTRGWGRKKRVVSPGKLSWEMVKDWLGPKGIILRGGGLDEAPQVYRRLPDVLEAQGDTIRVLHTLHPLIVVMAGENEFDPYKD